MPRGFWGEKGGIFAEVEDFFLFYFSKCGGAPGRKYSRCPVWRCAIKKSKLQTPCGGFWGFFPVKLKLAPDRTTHTVVGLVAFAVRAPY